MSNPNLIVTPAFRLSFPAVFKRKKFDGEEGEGAYEITMLLPKEGSDLKALKAGASRVTKEKFPDGTPKKFRSPFRDGDDEEDFEDKEIDGKIVPNRARGYWVVKAKSKIDPPPQVVDLSRRPITEESGDIYAGCWCRASVIPFAYDGTRAKGVTFLLQNVQKLRDDEPFGGASKSDAADDFDDSTSVADDFGSDADDLGF